MRKTLAILAACAALGAIAAGPPLVRELDSNYQQGQALAPLSLQQGGSVTTQWKIKTGSAWATITGYTALLEFRSNATASAGYSAASDVTSNAAHYIQVPISPTQTGTALTNWCYSLIVLDASSNRYAQGTGVVNVIAGNWGGGAGTLTTNVGNITIGDYTWSGVFPSANIPAATATNATSVQTGGVNIATLNVSTGLSVSGTNLTATEAAWNAASGSVWYVGDAVTNANDSVARAHMASNLTDGAHAWTSISNLLVYTGQTDVVLGLASGSTVADATMTNEPVSLQQLTEAISSRGQHLYAYGNDLYTNASIPPGVLYRSHLYQSGVAAVTSAVSGITNDQYIGAAISTGTYSRLDAGPVDFSVWCAKGAAGTLTVKAEFYRFDGTNEYELGASVSKTIGTSIGELQWTVNIGATNFVTTNAIIGKLKAITATANPTMTIYTDGDYDSHFSLPSVEGGAEVDPVFVAASNNLLHVSGGTMAASAIINMSGGQVTNANKIGLDGAGAVVGPGLTNILTGVRTLVNGSNADVMQFSSNAVFPLAVYFQGGINGVSETQTVSVASDTNAAGVLAVSTNGQNYTITGGTNITLTAGANITLTTNGAANWTIAGAAGGSGNQTPLTNNVNMAGYSITNGYLGSTAMQSTGYFGRVYLNAADYLYSDGTNAIWSNN